MLKWMKKKRFVVTSLVLGAMGCAKSELPRLGSGAVTSPPSVTTSSSPTGNASTRALQSLVEASTGTVRVEGCEALAGIASVSSHSIEEYAALRNSLKAMSPLVDNAQLVRAHAIAFTRVHNRVMRSLKFCATDDHQKKDFEYAAKQLSRQVNGFLGDFPLSGLRAETLDSHFNHLFQRVELLRQTMAISNAYMEMFYSEYVRVLDPFGSIVFGSTNTPAQPTTVGRNLISQVSEVERNMPVVQRMGNDGSVIWVTLLEWSPGAKADLALTTLEEAARASEPTYVILDLRNSGGYDSEFLGRVRDSARRGWGRLPMLLIVGYETYGTAAVFAYETTRADGSHVKVMSSDPATYGYARKLHQQARDAVAEGLLPVNLVIGSEIDNSFPGDTGHGFRLFIDDPLTEEGVTFDKAVNRVRGLTGAAPVDEPSPSQPAPGAPEASQVPPVPQAPEAPDLQQLSQQSIAQPQPQDPASAEIQPEAQPQGEIPSMNEERNGAPPRAFGP